MFTGMRPIDLTLLIEEQLPATWPPHVPFVRRTWNWFETTTNGPELWDSACGPYFTEVLIMDEHIGTHFDAPSHFVPEHAPGEPGAICGEDVDLSALCGPAVCIDVTGVLGDQPGASPFIEPAHLLAEEDRRGRRLAAGDAVLFRSDWDARFYRAGPEGRGYAFNVAVTKTSPGWPAPSVECMDLLLERGVRCVGTDGPSMGAAHDGAPVHVAGLSAGAIFVEGLSNLAAVPDEGAFFQFLPIKIARSSGSPGRAVAWVPASS